MKLMTKELEKRFAQVGEQIHTDNPLIICKFFTPRAYRTRYVTEYYPKDGVCYGYVVGDYPERWYFALPEIINLRWPFWQAVERDLYFGEVFFNELKHRWPM